MAAGSREANLLPEKHEELLERIQELEARLAESEETLRALRTGEVDAIVTSGPDGDHIYTLKGADAAYRQILEGMSEGALTVAHDGLILFSNERFAGLVSVPLEQVIGARLHDFIAAEDAHVLAAFRPQAWLDGKLEVRLQPAGAAATPAYLSWKHIRQDGTDLVSVIVTDLSEQKRNEEIVSAEKLARSILEQAADALLVVDLDGRIIRASRAADRLAGVPVLLRSFDEVFLIRRTSDLQAYPFRQMLLKVKDGAASDRMETTAITPDGRALQLLLTSAPLANPTGEPLGCIISLIDMTDRKRSEEALRLANSELRRLNDELNQFAYSASHDLQEPLRSITLYGQLLHQKLGAVDDETGEFLRIMVEGCSRMEALLHDLLAYTQVPSIQRDRQWADANAVLQKVLENLKTAVDECGAEVTSDSLPSLPVNEIHLHQLFQNLISNALKYRNPEVRPHIHIGVSQQDARWLFSVQDNGIGIAPEYHKLIFGIFKRLHTTHQYSGTGIGLAIAQKILQRYGGRIWVESQLGRGATFSFTLPSVENL